MTGATLRVLTWGGRWERALREAVSAPFEAATGIRVSHVRHVGLALPDALRAALDSGGGPPVDVVWSNSVPALRAAWAGHAAPLDPARMPAPGSLRQRAHPAGTAAGFVLHPYVVYYVLGYHRQAFPAGPPRSWQVLLDRRHRGRIALYPHGNGIHAVAQVMQGGKLADIPADMTACWEFLTRLRPQAAELAYSVGMQARLRSRELDLCFRALPNVLEFGDELPVGWSVPREGTSDTLDALWIPRGVPDATAGHAMRYLAFALSPRIQTDWCERLGVMPVHPAAAVPALLRRPDLPTHADDHRGILPVDEAVKAAHDDEWKRRFAELGFGAPGKGLGT